MQKLVSETFRLLYPRGPPETLSRLFRSCNRIKISTDAMMSLRCINELLERGQPPEFHRTLRRTIRHSNSLSSFESSIIAFRHTDPVKSLTDSVTSSDPFRGKTCSLDIRKAVSCTLPKLSRPVKILSSKPTTQCSTKRLRRCLPKNSGRASPIEVTEADSKVKIVKKPVRRASGVTLLAETPSKCRVQLKQGTRIGKPCAKKTREGEDRCSFHLKSLSAKEVGVLRCVRFRVHGTIHMQRLLPKWFGACRAIYNRCVNNDKKMKTDVKVLKKKLVTGKQPEAWMNACPNALRSEVPRDYIAGRKAAITLYQKKLFKFQYAHERWEKQGKRWKEPVEPKKPVMKHRTKKSPRSVLHIPKTAIQITENGFNLTFKVIKRECDDTTITQNLRRQSSLLSVNSRTKRKDKKFIKLLEDGCLKRDVRLIRYRDGRLFIEVPVDVQVSNTPTHKVAVGIDPGLRTPLVTAGTDGIIMEMGAKFKDNVKIHRERKGKLQNRLSKTTDKAKRKRIKKQIGRLHSKITNTRTQFHYEAIKELQPYQHVYLPKTSYKAWNRGLDRNSRRTCQEVAHPLLRNRLINKSEILGGGRVVHDCSEYMTTKTCSSCFRVHDKIGSSEVFTCPSCGVTVGRDQNAARNILLINLRV